MSDKPEWHYSINYGPEGEQDWAYLITPEGANVSNIRTHHAMTISRGMNERDMFLAALRAQELAENEHANCPDCEGIGDWAECGRCSELFGDAIDMRRAAFEASRPDLKVVK